MIYYFYRPILGMGAFNAAGGDFAAISVTLQVLQYFTNRKLYFLQHWLFQRQPQIISIQALMTVRFGIAGLGTN